MATVLIEKEVRTLVVGTGAAGYAAAVRLHQYGVRDLAILAENVEAGTSRNTGSDKQTYYKLSLAGKEADSVRGMAEDLFRGQCVDGELALCEAALSARCFYYLTELGVPFPDNEYGEYIGYQTDHDRGRRASSVGPYTSKIMTERLEREAGERQIPVLNHMQLIQLLVKDEKVHGVLCLDKSVTDRGKFVLIWCENVVLATGGPAGMYHDSVYPASQLGSSGIAFEAGVKGKNLTEWQFGMASLKPRWNVSGTYMQVLPRFISTDREGKNERVFLDFLHNPGGETVAFEKLPEEACEYLRSAGACFGTPIERLIHMNEPAVSFYLEHGVDLREEMLEIAVCVQHNNGGLSTDCHWQTNIEGIFAVGEVCGSHGVTRPGGTALNAGQTGAVRAAEYIAFVRNRMPWKQSEEARKFCVEKAGKRMKLLALSEEKSNLGEIWEKAVLRMSRAAGMIRNEEGLEAALEETTKQLQHFEADVRISDYRQGGMLYHLLDMLISQKVYLSAMLDYVRRGGGSRGSALYTSPEGEKPGEKMPELYRCRMDEGRLGGMIQEIRLLPEECRITWRPVRPIPEPDYFFENQWKAFRERRGQEI